jgi:hypothetical protein
VGIELIFANWVFGYWAGVNVEVQNMGLASGEHTRDVRAELNRSMSCIGPILVRAALSDITTVVAQALACGRHAIHNREYSL